MAKLLLLSMFAGPVEKDVSRHFEHAQTILGRYGFELTVWPYRTRPSHETYQALLDMTGSINPYDEAGAVQTIWRWARFCYPKQVAYMCPIVFCRLATKDNPGSTYRNVEAPRSIILIDPGKADAFPPTLAHEVGHAAGLCPHVNVPPHYGHDQRPDNLMFKGNEGSRGSNLDAAQVRTLAQAFFAQAG